MKIRFANARETGFSSIDSNARIDSMTREKKQNVRIPLAGDGRTAGAPTRDARALGDERRRASDDEAQRREHVQLGG